jgi:hypothetical protein
MLTLSRFADRGGAPRRSPIEIAATMGSYLTMLLDLPLPAGCWGFLGRASVPYVTRITGPSTRPPPLAAWPSPRSPRTSCRPGQESSPPTASTPARTATATGPAPSSPPSPRPPPENDWSGYEPESYTRDMTVTVRLLLAGPR